MRRVQLLFKTHISSHTRHLASGKVVTVVEHEDRRTKAAEPAPSKEFASGDKVTDRWGDTGIVVGPHETDPTKIYVKEGATTFSWPIENIAKTSRPSPSKGKPRKINTKRAGEFIHDPASGFDWPASGEEPLIYFHNTNSKEGFTVLDENPESLGVDFGGIFVGPGAGMDGMYTHAVILDPEKRMDHGDYNHFSEKALDAALRKVAPWLKKKSDRDDLLEYISEDKEVVDYIAESSEEDPKNGADQAVKRVQELFGTRISEWAELSWYQQALRAKFASALGYQSAAMSDETGVSTWVGPGARTYPLQDGESMSDAEGRIYSAWKDWKESGEQGSLTKSLPLVVRITRR